MDRQVMSGRSRPRRRGAGRARWSALAATVGVVGAMLVTAPLAAQAATPEPLEWRAPGTYTWRVPDGVTEVHVDVAGGAGGNRPISQGPYIGGSWGGLGGRVQGTLEVTPGSVLQVHVARVGDDGATGGGSGSYGAGGSGFRTGGNGGSGSSVAGLSAGQGGGGGGGASAISLPGAGSVPLVVAGGGGGAGGFAWCGGNPGGDAGRNAIKVPNSCNSDGGDPGLAGETAGPGGQGQNARSASGQGGGGGGGGGYRGGGGGDASTDGGGGGGGGTNYGAPGVFSTENMGTAPRGHGFVVLTPTYGTQTAFEHHSYTARAGQDLVLDGTVGYPGDGPSVPPQGTVELAAGTGAGWTTLGTVPLDGTGRFSFTCGPQCPLDVDATQVRAVYQPSQARHWTSSSATAELEALAGATRTSLVVDPHRAVTGQERELTASVDVQPPASGTATGEVEFWSESATGDEAELIGTAELGANGQAVLEAATPFLGQHRVWARYTGGGWFEGSTSARRTLVNDPAETEVSAVTVPAPSVYGQSYEVRADVSVVAPGSGTPSGVVEVDGRQAELADGRAVIAIPGGDAGTHDLTVEYLGDEAFLGSETALQHVVDLADTAITIAQEEENSVYGDTVRLTVEAEPAAPGSGEVTGEVEILLDGEASGVTGELRGSRAEIALDGLDAGSHTIAARYHGSGNSHPATSEEIRHEVAMASPVVGLTPDRESLTVGGDAGLAVDVSAETGAVAEGEVEVRHAGTEELLAEGTLVDGEVTLEWSQPPVGEHELIARYLGSANVAAGESEAARVTVTPAESATTLEAPEEIVAEERLTLTARVETVDPEAASAPGLFAPEAMRIFAQPPASTASPGTVEARWRPFAPEGEVRFFVNGDAVGEPIALTATTDGGAEAVLRTSLDAGEHTIEARYSGEERVLASVSDPVVLTVPTTSPDGDRTGGASAAGGRDGEEPGDDGSTGPGSGSAGPAGQDFAWPAGPAHGGLGLPSTGGEPPIASAVLGVLLLAAGFLLTGRRRLAG